jgi:hypothetical protein
VVLTDARKKRRLPFDFAQDLREAALPSAGDYQGDVVSLNAVRELLIGGGRAGAKGVRAGEVPIGTSGA